MSSTKNPYLDTAAASRYDSARDLRQQTKDLWMDALRASIEPAAIKRILDLGCGTGRFTSSLAQAFNCPVVGVEPSVAMLDVARSQATDSTPYGIEWKQSSAEDIPLEDHSVDLVFMSQVVHHLVEPERVLQEIDRVLAPQGYLAIRNGTQESDREIPWYYCFPEAVELGEKRIPSRAGIIGWVSRQGFTLVSQQAVEQLFTDSYQECYNKVSQRGLSALISIPDEAFERGLQCLQDWVAQQPPDIPVYESVDLFVFRKG